MRKGFTAVVVLGLVFAALAGVAQGAAFDGPISVVSREDGSGTRGAFIELFGIEARDGATRKDMTTKEAIIADKTDIVMTNIAGDPNAIGYISLGSVNGSVKALDIDGAAASVENVKNGSYKIQRPFNIAVKGEGSALAKNFIGFILSKEGQEAAAASKYIAVNPDAPAYSAGSMSGKIVVAGSSSVNPLMEKLREAYIALNPGAVIEIQMNDSTAGLKAAMDGTCDIGMSSRALKESELAVLSATTIAIDGIAVIVNNGNPITNLTGGQVKSIFTGEVTEWSAVN